jgi:hypothetical protein
VREVARATTSNITLLASVKDSTAAFRKVYKETVRERKGVLAFYSWFWLVQGEPVGASFVLIPLLTLASLPIVLRAARTNPGYELPSLLVIGLLVRFVGAFPRFQNAADAVLYHSEGVRLAASYRQLDFSVDVGRDIPGTGGARLLSGLTHVIVNDDAFAAFLVFAWFGFLGCYLCYRALVLAFPEGNHRRYAVLLMLWPSLAFWPSSLGKEGWVLLAIGVTALGAARAYTRKPGGYVLLFIGLAGATLIRPHVAMLLVLAFGVAFLVGRRGEAAPGTLTPGSVAKVAGLLLLLVLGSYLASRTQDFLELEDFSTESIQTGQEDVRAQTEEGASEFDAPDPFSPIGYPVALVTVIARPFPFEASGSEQILTAGEGLVILGLLLGSWRRYRSLPRLLRSRPYVTFALTFVLVFVAAFGVISNFGILARQRTQVLPFVFVLLSLPAAGTTAEAQPRPKGLTTRRPYGSATPRQPGQV